METIYVIKHHPEFDNISGIIEKCIRYKNGKESISYKVLFVNNNMAESFVRQLENKEIRIVTKYFTESKFKKLYLKHIKNKENMEKELNYTRFKSLDKTFVTHNGEYVHKVVTFGPIDEPDILLEFDK